MRSVAGVEVVEAGVTPECNSSPPITCSNNSSGSNSILEGVGVRCGVVEEEGVPCGAAEEGEGAQEVEGEAGGEDLVAGDDKAPQSTPKVNNSDQTHFLSLRKLAKYGTVSSFHDLGLMKNQIIAL